MRSLRASESTHRTHRRAVWRWMGWDHARCLQQMGMCCKPVFQEDPDSTHRGIFEADGLNGEEYGTFSWETGQSQRQSPGQAFESTGIRLAELSTVEFVGPFGLKQGLRFCHSTTASSGEVYNRKLSGAVSSKLGYLVACRWNYPEGSLLFSSSLNRLEKE